MNEYIRDARHYAQLRDVTFCVISLHYVNHKKAIASPPRAATAITIQYQS